MAEYERCIAYIYQYDGIVKGKNIGFVKAESRGEQNRIQLSLRHAYGLEGVSVQVFGLKAESGTDVGIRLGQMELSGGEGEFQWESSGSEVEPGCPFRALRGVCLQPHRGGQCMAGVWNGSPFERAHFQIKESQAAIEERTGPVPEPEKPAAAEQNPPMSVSERAAKMQIVIVPETEGVMSEPVVSGAEPSETAVSGTEMPEPEASEAEPAAPEASGAERSDSAVPEQEAAEAPGRAASAANASETAESNQEAEEEVSAASAPAVSTVWAEPASRGSGNAVKTAGSKRQPAYEESSGRVYSPVWEILSRRYGKCRPFAEDRGIQCIQVKPADLSRLARAYRSLSGNSFLLHGYYRYNHLLLIQMEAGVFEQRVASGRNVQSSSPHYLLGVPGYYQSGEKSMAGMFGFQEFLPASARVGTGDGFGYWCMEVQM